MKAVGREILWNLPHSAAVTMYALFGVVLLVFAWGMHERIRAYRRGRPEREDRLDALWDRTLDALKIGIGQRKVLERTVGGWMHLAIYSSFLVLFVITCLVAVEYDFGVMILDGTFYIVFKLFADTFGLLLAAGVLVALVRRYAFRPKGLTRDGDDLLQLFLLGSIAVTGFLVEGVRLAATRPSAAPFSFVANAIASPLRDTGVETLLTAHRMLWWTHLLLAFAFLATIPLTKMLHLGAGVVNIFLRTSRPKGALQPIPGIEEEERPGVTDVDDFSWKQLLSSDACTKCGRCQDECPAFAAEMPLSPRDVVLKTQAHMCRDLYSRLVPSSAAPLDPKTGRPSAPAFTRDVLFPDEIWACTTCRACMEACPVLIEHIDMIVDVRRGYVANAKIPDTARTALRKMGDTGNPWGLPQDDRAQWARGLDVPLASDGKEFEYLYWVGCAGAYDPRNQKVSRTLVSLLNRAGVSYATLGLEETCCGESARRMGEEGLFQLGMVEAVGALFREYKVRKVITQCPHCFNTFRNEYPQFGVQVEAIHHSVLLRDLVAQGRLVPEKPVGRFVAFHDSCYLGRHNDLYDAPRDAIRAVPALTLYEPENSRERGFCCGAGGGGMWLEIPGKRINHLRFDQLMKTGADATASACPYCLIMFDDAVKFHDLEESVQARDIAEILAESL